MPKHSRLERLRPKPDRIAGVLGGTHRDPAAVALRLATNLGVPPFRLASGLRNTLYDAGVIRAVPLGRPTISVGNLTTGGTGKTPMVVEVVRRLTAMGRKPAVLLRGYEPAGLESRQGSDEAAELRGSLGGDVSVMADGRRVRGAAAVLDRYPETDCFILDDGFQHRRAARDLNLVLIDASCPFGYGRVLPRGLLREPPGRLRRADAVVVTRADRATPEALRTLDQRIERLTGRPPLAHARHRWAELRQARQTLPVAYLAGKTVLGCCGLGNPTDFEASLRGFAGRCVGCVVFEDHRRYNRDDIAGVFHTARERGADAVVVTEKDWVKWRRFGGGVKASLPVLRPVLRMAFLDDEEAFEQTLADAVG
ncbi:MAG: tetraacyldisaccharide 4'-kinase [Planctomycetota bacterium]